MTLEQIEVFITVAKFMNFTKASETLFMTQPNVSRAISALENELNMQLFIRQNHNLRLTPAGKVLYNDLSDSMTSIKSAFNHASDINKGYTGDVNIGVLSGTDISDFMPNVLSYFREKHPNIKIALHNTGFRDIIRRLYDETLDFAFSLEFNLQDHRLISYDILEETPDNIVIPYTSPLFEKEDVTLEDLAGQDVIVVSPEELDLTNKSVLELFKQKHIVPTFHHAPNLQTAILWMQSGIGVGFLFSRSLFIQDPKFRTVEIPSPWQTNFVVGKNIEHQNPAADRVYDYCRQMIEVEEVD